MKKNFFSLSDSRPLFERVSASFNRGFRLVPHDTLDDKGDMVVSDQLVEIDLKKPQTPQSGVECLVNDLSFMLKSGRDISHDGTQLSMFSSGNPFENARKVEEIARELESSSKS